MLIVGFRGEVVVRSFLRGVLSFVIFGVWCILFYFQFEVVFCVGVVVMCVYGVVGVYQCKIIVCGKFGLGKMYVGFVVVCEGIFIVFVSLVFGLVGVFVFWFFFMWWL